MAKDKDAKKPGDAAPEAAETEKPKGGGKKLLIIGLAAGLLAGGGGAAGYFLFLAPPAAPEQEPAPVAEPEPAPAPTSFVTLEKLSAPLVHDGEVMGYVLLDLSLEVAGPEEISRVNERLPALKAAFLRDVTATPIGKADAPLVIDYEALTARLREVANRELPQPDVLRVLITQSTRL